MNFFKIYKKLIESSFILSLPGFFSIFISLVSIPIHLNIAGSENYGNYIIFHFILILTQILNFGIGKSIVISINNFPKMSKEISYEGIKYTCYLTIIISIFFFIFSNLNINFSTSLIIINIEIIYMLIGTIVSIWYLTLEGIFQGNEKFKFLSFFNFIFYSLSLSLPSLLLLKYSFLNNSELILIALIIKIIGVLVMLILICSYDYLKRSKNETLYKNLKKNSKWISLNIILVQFYDVIDKFFIKYFIGPIALATYSIPQQLTGKLSILSKGISAFLLPNLSKKNTSINNLNFTLDVFLRYIPIFIFIIYPFFEIFLSFWLNNQFNENILILTKIFSISAIFSCASHILVTNFEAKKKLKINLKIEFFILPVFLSILIYFIITNQSLVIISIIILIKEFLLLTIRLYLMQNIYHNFVKYLFFNLIYFFMIFLSFNNIYLFYFGILFLTVTNLKLNSD